MPQEASQEAVTSKEKSQKKVCKRIQITNKRIYTIVKIFHKKNYT